MAALSPSTPLGRPLSTIVHSLDCAPVRLMAAKAVVAEMGGNAGLKAVLFRLGEFSANCLLYCGVLWKVTAWAVLPSFLLFWYLPAVIHTRSWWAPIRFPLLNFVVDDFSFLGLHPHLRHCRGMYKAAVVRVALMFLILIMFYIPSWSFLPPSLVEWFEKSGTSQVIGKFKNHGKIPHLVRGLWECLSVVVLVASALWLIATSILLCVPTYANVPTPFFRPRRDDLIERIDIIAAEVQDIVVAMDVSSDDSIAECRFKLQQLQETRWPTLQLTNVFSTLGPAWAALLHFGTDCGNMFTFVDNGDYGFAGFLVFTMAISFAYAFYATRRGPHRIVQETFLSLKSGAFSHDFLVVIRADKGIQMVPALLLQVYGLPFAAKGWPTALCAAGSIAATVCFVVPFIHHEFDLGVEVEGMDQMLAQARAETHAIRTSPSSSLGSHARELSSAPLAANSFPVLGPSLPRLPSVEEPPTGALESTDNPC